MSADDRADSTHDRLARRGLTHRPSPCQGKREVVDAWGVVLMTGTCGEVNAWLNREDAADRLDRLARCMRPQRATALAEMDAAAADEADGGFR